MSLPTREGTNLRIPEEEFEAMMARAAEQGARRALADVGLVGPEAAIDIYDLRTLLDSLRMARRTPSADPRAILPCAPSRQK